MRKTSLLSLFISIQSFSFAQDTTYYFPKNLYSKIFNQAYLNQPPLQGVFDSTDSWFSVFQDTVFQSPFDSICLRNTGKTWHRGKNIHAKTYLTINNIQPFQWELDLDSENMDTLMINKAKRLEKKKLALWICEGEFFMNEEDTAEYAGRFSGTFHLYFLYDDKKQTTFACTTNELPEKEPAVLFYGFWRALHHKELAVIPYFWASTQPFHGDEGWVLPDLRLQTDGSQSYFNNAVFDDTCLVPKVNWWK